MLCRLFDKRGAIYSHRPESYLANALLCPGETHLLLMGYTAAWRKLRKVFMSVLNITTVQSLRALQEAESNQTMKDLCDTPDLFEHHIRRYSTSVILSCVFGHRGASFEDPRVNTIYKVQDQFSEILEPGNIPPVDAFPLLKYVPESLAKWKQRARKVREGQQTLYLGLLRDVRDRMARGKPVNCFMDKLLSASEVQKSQVDDLHLAYIGGVMMEAGSDTTSSTLLSFILAMMKHPHILAKAQEEVDRVCSSERSPQFQDVQNLPYIRACSTEVCEYNFK